MLLTHAVIVTGARSWPVVDHECWECSRTIEAIVADHPPETLVLHGDARGVDAIADRGAHSLFRGRLPYPVDHGRGDAGLRRNTVLIDLAESLARVGVETSVHGFPTQQSRGTLNCLETALSRSYQLARDSIRMPVWVHSSDEEAMTRAVRWLDAGPVHLTRTHPLRLRLTRLEATDPDDGG